MGRVKVSHSSAMLGIHRRCPWLAPRGQCPAEGVIVGRPRSAFLLRAIAATHGAWQGGAARVSAGEARGALNHGRKTLAASRRGWHRSAFESRPGKPARHGDRVAVRAIVMQQKTSRPVQFEITESTREAVAAWIKGGSLRSEDYLFPSRLHDSLHLSTRQYAHIVDSWVEEIGLDPANYGTHSMPARRRR